MKRIKILVLVAAMVISSASILFAGEEAVGSKEQKEAPVSKPVSAEPDIKIERERPLAVKALKEMPRENLVKEIIQMVGYSTEILRLVPGMEMAKDEKGAIIFTYKKGESAKARLDSLDRETLESLYRKTYSAMVRVNTEKTARQMKEIRNIQEMNRRARDLRTSQRVGVNTYKPTPNPTQTRVPRTPKTPVSAPKIPRR